MATILSLGSHSSTLFEKFLFLFNKKKKNVNYKIFSCFTASSNIREIASLEKNLLLFNMNNYENMEFNAEYHLMKQRRSAIVQNVPSICSLRELGFGLSVAGRHVLNLYHDRQTV